MIKHLIPALLIIGGAVVFSNAVLASVLSNLSTGVWLTYIIGLLLVTGGLTFHRLPLWVLLTGGIGLLAVLLSITMLFLSGKADTVTHKEDVLIVLGASIRGDKPTESLQNRLDRAIEIHKQNPDAVIVVSGGKGTQETVTEAYAMEHYLIENDIPASKILKEEAATSTKENFRFCKALLDAHFEDSYTACFVTTDYHIYRAAAYADQSGFTDITHAHSRTPWYMLIPSGLRECLAVCKLWIIQN